ncbi:HIT family protein [Kitasatospora sp. NPDC006697]|uniref:HIT family protein n=1 Tax=Kitasatospora sp. NPDC006697 TaxID=3364020 RepID=UPI0036AFFA4A
MIDNQTTEPGSTEAGAFVRSLPIGERIPLPADGIPFWDVFPYEGDIQIKVLEPPVLPEPPRNGEHGPEGCFACERGAEDPAVIWANENWMVRTMQEPAALPVMVSLLPRGHYDLTDLPAELVAEMGVLLQRVERAILSLGGIARVHVNRWGDGGAHLHWWLIARPEGMLQMRGTCLPLWDDLLPKQSAEAWAETSRRLAQALATA